MHISAQNNIIMKRTNSMVYASRNNNQSSTSEQFTVVSYEEACITDARDTRNDVLFDAEDEPEFNNWD